MEFDISVDKKTTQVLTRGLFFLVLAILAVCIVFAKVTHILWLNEALDRIGEYIFTIFLFVYLIGSGFFGKARLSFDGDTMVLTGIVPFPRLRIFFSDIERVWVGNSSLSAGGSLISIIPKGSMPHDMSNKKTIFIKYKKKNDPLQIKGRGQGVTDSIVSFVTSYGIHVEEKK